MKLLETERAIQPIWGNQKTKSLTSSRVKSVELLTLFTCQASIKHVYTVICDYLFTRTTKSVKNPSYHNVISLLFIVIQLYQFLFVLQIQAWP
jgi:hypothetical protein